MITSHTDVIGSLLRPERLLFARDAFSAGEMDETVFTQIEDEAVDEAIRLQEEAGFEVVTDGEMRRLSFQSQMTEAVEGFGQYDLDAFLWGDWKGGREVGDRAIDRPTSLGVVSKLERRRHLSTHDFSYLKAHTDRIAKVTLPSASLWANFWSPRISRDAYPTLDSFLADVTDILRDEVAALVALGAAYIQIDAPHYTMMIDPTTRAFYESQGWDLERWLSAGIEMDNAVMAGHPEVTFGFHL